MPASDVVDVDVQARVAQRKQYEPRLLARSRQSEWWRVLVICAGGYLYGSLPVVYLLGKRKRVDLQRSGSGNVGATNLMRAAGPARAAAGWIFDASKGIVPAWIVRAAGGTQREAELAGVCGVAGQCWPLFLRFNGGRGISAFVGAAFALDRVSWIASIAPMIGGSLWRVIGSRRTATRGVAAAPRSRSVPFGCFLGVFAFWLVSMLRRKRPPELVAPTLLSGIVMARRLTAPQPDDSSHGPRVAPMALLFRLLYDRNTPD